MHKIKIKYIPTVVETSVTITFIIIIQLKIKSKNKQNIYLQKMYKTKITKWDDYKQEPLKKRIENQRKDIQYSKFSIRLNIQPIKHKDRLRVAQSHSHSVNYLQIHPIDFLLNTRHSFTHPRMQIHWDEPNLLQKQTKECILRRFVLIKY